MNKRVLYHKKTGEPVQLIAQAQTQPNYQDVVCYQELTSPFEYYVMERGAFFATYTRTFDELPEKNRRQIEKHADLPDKKAARRLKKKEKAEKAGSKDPIEMGGPIGMGGPIAMDGPTDGTVVDEEFPEDRIVDDPMEQKMMDFFEARTYAERIRIFEDMKGANDHILANIAVSQDIALDEKADNYERILAELRLRKKFEVDDRRP